MSGGSVLLLSGGMDSATLLWWLKERSPDAPVAAVSIDYGQRHRIELEHAEDLARLAGVRVHKRLELNLNSIGGSPLTDGGLEVPAATAGRQVDTVVPLRNMLLVTAAAAYAETQGVEDLYVAPVKDDYDAYRDCRRAFFDGLEQALRLGATRDIPFRLHTPFVEMWKTEVVALGLRLGVPYGRTHTCYAGTRPACGRCDACAERLAAFAANGAEDPLEYTVH